MGQQQYVVAIDPDLILLLNVRSIVSLIGIVIIVYYGTFSLYSFEKLWDNEGPNEVRNIVGGLHPIDVNRINNDDDVDDDEDEDDKDINEQRQGYGRQQSQSQSQLQSQLQPMTNERNSVNDTANANINVSTNNDDDKSKINSNNVGLLSSASLTNSEYILDTLCHADEVDEEEGADAGAGADADAGYKYNTMDTTSSFTGYRVMDMINSINVSPGTGRNNQTMNEQQQQHNDDDIIDSDVLEQQQHNHELRLQRLKENKFYKAMLLKYNSWTYNHNNNNINNNNSNDIVLAQNILHCRYITLFGWVLLTLAFYCDPRYYKWHSVLQNNYYSNTNSTTLFFITTLSITIVYSQYYQLPITCIVRYKTFHYYWLLTMYMLLFGITLSNLSSIIITNDNNTVLLVHLLPIAASVGISYAIYYSYRSNCRMNKRSYTINGLPDGKGVVFHEGSVLVAIGWFLIWITMNSFHPVARPSSNYTYLPIYLTNRITIALVGIGTIISHKWIFGYLQDETVVQSRYPSQHMTIYCCILSVTGWTILGTCVFNENYYVSTMWKPRMLFIFLLVHGILDAIHSHCGIRYCNIQITRTTTVCMICNYIILTTLVCWNSGTIACALTIVAFVLIVIGDYILFSDRKRGRYWLSRQLLVNNTQSTSTSTSTTIGGIGISTSTTTKNDSLMKYYTDCINDEDDTSTTNVNPYYQVYTIGPVLYTTGMLVFVWALSIIPS